MFRLEDPVSVFPYEPDQGTAPWATAAEALAFYQRNYISRGFWVLEAGKQFPIIGNAVDRRCRFCGEAHPKAKFRKEAHAIPQALGNRNLLTAYECDDCNQFFGDTIENDFGGWSKPMRTMGRIPGSSGKPPTLKGPPSAPWRIEDTPGGLHILHDGAGNVIDVDHEAKQVTFRLLRDSYRPVGVLKAFVKMGLSLIPDEDVQYFADTIRWVRSPDHANPHLSGHIVMVQTFPGPSQSIGTGLALLRRKDDWRRLPFYFLSIAYGPYVFQVVIPSSSKDWMRRGTSIALPLFPHDSDESIAKNGEPRTATLDLTGLDVVRGEVETMVFGFDDMTPVDT